MRRLLLLTATLSAALTAACGEDRPTPVPLTKVAPTISSTPVTAATVGELYTYTIVASGTPKPTVATVLAPRWLRLEGTTLTGTPTTADVGRHDVVITASNDVEPAARQTFTVVVAAATAAPAITSTPMTSAVAGMAYRYRVTATGSPAPTLRVTTFGEGALPGWLTFDATTGELTGTPSRADVGRVELVVTAANGVSPDAIQAFTLMVTAEGAAPSFTSTPVVSARVGQAYSYTVAVDGMPTPTVVAMNLPSWLSFDAGTLTLSGTPGAADVGAHELTLSATNGIQPDARQTFTVTVEAAPTTAPAFTSAPVSMASIGVAYSYTITTSGNPPATVRAVTLPAWLSLAGNVLSGTPGVGDLGNNNLVELSATNGVPPDASQRFTIVVGGGAAPAITSVAPTSALANAAYSYTVIATGVPAPTLSAARNGGGALPAWLTFDAATGVLSGTPAAADVGATDVTITAQNGIAPDATQSFTITVSLAPVAPAITSTPLTNATTGAPYSYAITATGVPSPTLSVARAGGAALPAWLTFDAGSGTLSGTPAVADVGAYALVVTAQNGTLPNATQSFTLTVAQAPAAPAITSTPVTSAVAGLAYLYTVVATGVPTPTLSATGPGGAPLPAWLSFNAGTGALSGLPSALDIGAHTVVVTAQNGVGTAATQSFTITVAPAPAAPSFTSTPITQATVGVAYSYHATASGSPAPTLSSGTLPAWLNFDAATGFLTGTPGAGDVGGHAITLTAQNGVGTAATQSFTITVAPAPAAPIITSTPVLNGTAGMMYLYTVVATGVPTPTLSASGASGAPLPAWLTFDAATGVLSGLPSALDAGAHSVVITAQNGVLPSATQSFTITIIAPVAPTISSTPPLTATVGQLYSYDVVAAGTPTPTLSATGPGGAALPPWLTFDAAVRRLSGTPGAGDVGFVDVVIAAQNGVAPDAAQSFTVNVSAAGVAPTITSVAPTTAVIGVAYGYTITFTGSPTPTLGVTGLPAWLTFDGNNTLTGTPPAGSAGVTGAIAITASNGVGTPATQSFTITVSPPPSIALAGNPYSQDFTAAPANWTATGDWQFGTPTTGANTVGPPSLYDGNVAATNLTGNYTNGRLNSLTTPNFDFTGVTAPTLRFVHWHNLEGTVGGSRYDGANIKISTDGGTTWAQLTPASVTPAYSGALVTTNVMGAQVAWTGILTNWTLVTVDLTADLAGRPLTQVALRFDMGSDTTVNRPGWYVDVVRIGAAAQLPVAPAITSVAPAARVVANTAFSHTITVTGQPAPTVTVTGPAGAALPPWLTFNATTGVLSGTPTNADAGDYALTVTAQNGEPPTATQTFTLTVVPVVTIANYTFLGDVRTPDTQATNTTSGNFDNRDGTSTFVTGNPDRAVTTNGFNNPANPNYFQFTVTPAAGYQIVPQALSFISQRSGTGPTTYQVSVVVNGVETPLTAGAGTLPTASVWTPGSVAFGAGESGPFTGPVTFRFTGSGASAQAGTWRMDNIALTGLVTVRDNAAPTITTNPPTTAAVGVAYSHVIGVDGWPAPTVAVTGRPAWLAFDAATRTLSGTPSVLDAGTSGTITITASNGVLPDATRTFTITVAPAAAVVIAAGAPVVEGFGTALPTGWGARGEWQFGLATTGANTVGPPSLYDGALAATNLTGNYSASTVSTLQTPVYDLSGVTGARLQFVHWHNFESSGTSRYDGGNIKISTDGGATWAQLAAGQVTPAYTGTLVAGNAMGAQSAWSGILTDWTVVVVDLAAAIGANPATQVAIRFEAGSDTSVQRPGWYLDDVRIGAAADVTVAPVVTSAAQLSAREGVAYSYVVSASGAPRPTYSAASAGGGALPAWLTFNATTRTLSGTPPVGAAGTVDLQVTATNGAGSNTQTFTLTVFPAGATPVFSDGFEAGLGSWVIGFGAGTASDWAVGTPSVVGPPAAATGTQCAGTVLAGNYTDEARLSYLQTPVLDLTGVPMPAVRFRQWYDTEAGRDGGNIKISTDGGANFSPLLAGTVTPAYTGALSNAFGNPMGGQPSWSGAATAWTVIDVDLRANLVGLPQNQVVIRYEFASDATTGAPGWYVDDVSVGDVVTLP